jgi:hypothetical protein
MYSNIISTHIKPHLSGVAQFGSVLAQKLNIPLISFFKSEDLREGETVLLTVSFSIPDVELETRVWRFMEIAEEKKITFSVFFHSFSDLPIEHALIKKAARIFSGNDEIYHELLPFHVFVKKMWSPPLLRNGFIDKPDMLNIFSFGMAYKIQTAYHRLFASKLKQLKKDFVIRISTGFHEKANFGKYDDIAKELEGIYENKVHFYGFLSDEAVGYFIQRSDVYVNFFPKGARANNTTLFAVMERARPVITNLDEHSPSWMKSGVNIIDIRDLDKKMFDKKVLDRIGKKSCKDVWKYTNWDILVRAIKNK